MQALLLHERAVILRGDSADLGTVLAPNSVDAIVTDPPAGVGFMGSGWDGSKGGRDKWIAWLAGLLAPSVRALKPGGYGLFWALPRTSHWTATAIEDSGLEIFDIHHHWFGSGMPKSLDLMRQIDMHLCELPGRHYDKNLPTPSKLREGDHLCPEHPRRVAAEYLRRTALKPACEHWIMARKPIEGTYARNVLTYGTGGLGVEALRVGTELLPEEKRTSDATLDTFKRGPMTTPERSGRWPAHLSMDESIAELLDEQSGITTSHASGYNMDASNNENPTRIAHNIKSGVHFGDSGGASRFFYVAKPARSEKDAGLDHLPARTAKETNGRDDDSHGTNNPRAGAGRTGGARNIHPTVKPLELMDWLVRLVTKEGGLVLDPFAGSGTTGVAALNAGRNFVGCEQGGDDGEYVPILVGRIRAALGMPQAADTFTGP